MRKSTPDAHGRRRMSEVNRGSKHQGTQLHTHRNLHISRTYPANSSDFGLSTSATRHNTSPSQIYRGQRNSSSVSNNVRKSSINRQRALQARYFDNINTVTQTYQQHRSMTNSGSSRQSTISAQTVNDNSISKLSILIVCFLGFGSGMAVGYGIYFIVKSFSSPADTIIISPNSPDITIQSQKEFNFDKNIPLDSLNSPGCGTIGSSRSQIRKVRSVFNISDGGRIVGGHNTRIEKHPWQVSLWWAGNHKCGGSIIAPKWVLSAAHCAALMKGRGTWVAYAGEVKLQNMRYYAQKALVTHFILHESFDSVSFNHDVALLRLDKSFTTSASVGTICLPKHTRKVKVGATCQITGWGSRVEKSPPSLILQEANVQILDRNLCNRRNALVGLVSRNMFCAGRFDGSIDACQGDSGGPLTCYDNSQGRAYQMGLVSWGVGCGVKNRPGVYTNLPLYTGWIQHKINVFEKKYEKT